MVMPIPVRNPNRRANHVAELGEVDLAGLVGVGVDDELLQLLFIQDPQSLNLARHLP